MLSASRRQLDQGPGIPAREVCKLKLSVRNRNSAAPLHQGLTQPRPSRGFPPMASTNLPRAGRRSPLRIVLEVLREPMLALLIAGGVVYLLLGNLEEGADPCWPCCPVGRHPPSCRRHGPNVCWKALRDLTSPRALVIRAENDCGSRAESGAGRSDRVVRGRPGSSRCSAAGGRGSVGR